MKNLFLITILFLSLTAFGQGVSVVRVVQLGTDYAATPPTVEFRVYWDAAPDNINHLDSVWIFVDYQPISVSGTAGAWTPATLSTPATASAGTVIPVAGNTRGFYLRGTPAAGFSSTVTVELAGLVAGDKFNWCAYVSDYPPNATPGAGFYDLHGTPPFVVNGNTLGAGVRNFSGCIDALTDATGCPGLIPAKPEITAFTPLFDTICEGETVILSAAATGASEYSFDGGTTWQAGNSASVAPTTDATYIVKVRNASGCTVTAAAAASIKVYPKPVATFSTAPSTACGGSSVTVVADGGSSYCFTHSCTACGRNPYRNGNDDPADFDCFFRNDSCAFDASNSYTFSMPDSGSITVCVRVINEHGCLDTACTTITVSVLPPVPILAGGGSLCATSAALTCFGESGYAYQLQNNLLQNVGTVQTGAGAPLTFSLSATGTYTVVITDPATGCTVMSNAETLTSLAPIITRTSGSANQSVIINTGMSAVVYQTTNASGAIMTGSFPPGVSGSWTGSGYSISGTPTLTGTYPYTITTVNTNGCAEAFVNDTIAVTAIAITGCTTSSIPLGTVGFSSTDTWVVGAQTWSAPITVTYCAKTTYDGGSTATNIFHADCRSNAALIYGDLFSWCMASQYAERLCPSPWRVPTAADFCTLDKTVFSRTDCNPRSCTCYTTLDGPAFGGSRAGFLILDGVISAQNFMVDYWSTTRYNTTQAICFAYHTSFHNPPCPTELNGGFPIRCVKGGN